MSASHTLSFSERTLTKSVRRPRQPFSPKHSTARLPGRERFVETRPPGGRIMRRRGELSAGGAAPGGEVEALGVEPDRPPDRAQGFVSGEPRKRGLAERVHLRDEPLLRLRVSAASPSREARTSAGSSGAARPKPPLKCTASIRSRQRAKSAKPAYSPALGLRCKYRTLARGAAHFSTRPPKVTRGLVERVAAFVAAGQQERRRAGRGRGSWCGATAST